MFGLSTAEILEKAIIDSSQNNINVYKQDFKENFEKMNNSNEEELNEILKGIRFNYLNLVSECVFKYVKASSLSCDVKLSLTILNPSSCGYEVSYSENGMMAGSVFAICYYVFKDKTANPRDCIRLNHLQNYIMEKANIELRNEYKLNK